MAKAVILNDSNGEEVYPVTDISLVNGELNGAKIVNASVGSDKLTPNAVWNENIKDGAVSNAKIDWSSTSRPIYYRGTDWAKSWTFKYNVYHPQLIFVAWDTAVAMFVRIYNQIYKVFQTTSRTVTTSIDTTNHTWTLSTDNTGVVNVLELRNTKTDD